VLVIGYGNELRRDDALGPHLGRAIAGWNLPGVTIRVCHQLLPELAEAISGCDAVFFLDAHLDSSLSEVSVSPMDLNPQGFSGGHVSDPQGLLALCAAVYGRVPRAWWVRLRAEHIGFGIGLSSAGHRRLRPAEDQLRPLVESQVSCMR
jgi:hydrogenase maturation protease